MQSEPQAPANGKAAGSAVNFAQVPSISLPKGGGAIRGIGEEFTANFLAFRMVVFGSRPAALVQSTGPTPTSGSPDQASFQRVEEANSINWP